MVNPAPAIMNNWFLCITSLGATNPPVYLYENFNVLENLYVVLRPETETMRPNCHKHLSTFVLVVEVVSRQPASETFNDLLAMAIENDILVTAYPQPSKNNISIVAAIPEFKIVDVQKEQTTYIVEADATYKYLRIITRHIHSIEYT